MNRKLKKLLKSAYNAQPERKYSFLNQLKSNPVWRKLHPLSTLSVISPSVIFILSTIAVIAVGTGITAHIFHGNDNDVLPVVPDIPPIVTVTTSFSARKSRETETTEVRYTEISVPQTELLTQKVQKTEVQKTEPQKFVSTVETQAKTTVFEVQQTELFSVYRTTVQTTAVTETETNIATTSVYYSHLLRHDYTTEDIMQDGTLLYGYPDSDIVNQIFSHYGGDYIELSLGFMDSPVIEGEIIGIEYTNLNGLPLTVCDVRISEVFDFNGEDVLNTGDVISIASYGGYMPVSEYISLNPDSTLFAEWSQEQIDSTILYEDGGNETAMKLNESYLFCLEPDKQKLNGTQVYFPLCYCDIFRFYRSGDGYICCNSATDGDISYEKLKEITEKYRYYFSEPDGDRKIMIKDDADLLMGIQNYYSVDSDGRTAFFDTTITDDGFFPFHSQNDYTIEWTDSGLKITYRYADKSDRFDIIIIDYPK